jgi:hypothetical protein
MVDPCQRPRLWCRILARGLEVWYVWWKLELAWAHLGELSYLYLVQLLTRF